MRVLLTTTSYQDTPGEHHHVIENSGYEIVRARGPLPEVEMIKLVKEYGGFDGLLNGDDEITAKFIDIALEAPTPLKVISKYGIGLDSIDVAYATNKGLPVLFTPGVNHTTVAEHAIGLIIGLAKHFWIHMNACKHGEWKRVTGHELMGKTVGIVGMGRIGRALTERAQAFSMNVIGYDHRWDDAFAREYCVKHAKTIDELLKESDIVSLHVFLSDETRGLINRESIKKMKDGAYLINTARGGLIVEDDVAEACRSGKLGGYGTDVLNEEPMRAEHPFTGVDNILMTPHVGSRTQESVERQAMRATKNLLNYLAGVEDYIQANN
ncbi:(S)-sulfolactate dehydrogenase [Poriferisphaera corsica]|uniref:(S)-sulfolactate dehydrogenase n=1 Tax=Poriferisphaera corsica TaxID=2528020 RepID=A0A517YQY6_9BACT|nr:phosphoglycerate dehydrogenase [Poriferisphaera corsica]QDU32613.1 (S)-sulfolactate dehydrogenase [Poriferisphaera corsica]